MAALLSSAIERMVRKLSCGLNVIWDALSLCLMVISVLCKAQPWGMLCLSPFGLSAFELPSSLCRDRACSSLPRCVLANGQSDGSPSGPASPVRLYQSCMTSIEVALQSPSPPTTQQSRSHQQPASPDSLHRPLAVPNPSSEQRLSSYRKPS